MKCLQYTFERYLYIYLLIYIFMHLYTGIKISYLYFYVLTVLCLFIMGQGLLMLQRMSTLARKKNSGFLFFDIAMQQFTKNWFH